MPSPRSGKSKPRRNPSQRWTPEEDEELRTAVLMHDSKNWKQIAQHFVNRTDIQCLQRWYEVLRPDLVKGPWTEEEDALLTELIEEHGCKKWSLVGEKIVGRSGKQCRERWCNQLDPNIKKDPWTEEEERYLVQCHLKFGSRWSEIARYVPGRPDNSIKNYWNSVVKKKMAVMEAEGTLPPPFVCEPVPFGGVPLQPVVKQATTPSKRKRPAPDSPASSLDSEGKRAKLAAAGGAGPGAGVAAKGAGTPRLATRVLPKFQLKVDTAMCSGESHDINFEHFLRDLEMAGVYYDEVSRPEAVSPFPVAYRNLFGTNVQEQRRSHKPAFLSLNLTGEDVARINADLNGGSRPASPVFVTPALSAANGKGQLDASFADFKCDGDYKCDGSPMPGGFLYHEHEDGKKQAESLPSLPELSRQLATVALPTGRSYARVGFGHAVVPSPVPGTASPGVFYTNSGVLLNHGHNGLPSMSPRFLQNGSGAGANAGTVWPSTADSPRLVRCL